jgi:F-type H+-transporting ATPase subunit b
MSELIEQLGLDWRLLASQAVNFLLLVVLLRLFAYKPLLKILKDRRARIEEGLAKADEAEVRLAEVDEIAKDKMKKTEVEAMAMMRATEDKAKKTEAGMLEEAHRKEAAMPASAEMAAKAKADEALKKLEGEAAAIVKKALVRTVEMDPKAVDEALVKKAVAEAAKTA